MGDRLVIETLVRLSHVVVQIHLVLIKLSQAKYMCINVWIYMFTHSFLCSFYLYNHRCLLRSFFTQKNHRYVVENVFCKECTVIEQMSQTLVLKIILGTAWQMYSLRIYFLIRGHWAICFKIYKDFAHLCEYHNIYFQSFCLKLYNYTGLLTCCVYL